MGIGVISNDDLKIINLTYDKPVDVQMKGRNFVQVSLDNYEFVLCEESARLLSKKLNAEFAKMDSQEWILFREEHYRERSKKEK